MKYTITYRLKHPQFLPTTSAVQVEAHTHPELDACLVKVMTKWQAQGYIVQVLSIVPQRRHRRRSTG